MGGNVFKNTQRASLFEKNNVGYFLSAVLPVGSFEFIGSCYRDDISSYGDIDVAVDEQYDEVLLDHISRNGLEHRQIGKTHFFVKNGVQVDVNFVNSYILKNWVVGASVTNSSDNRKAAFRNELFYVSCKYIFPGIVTKYDGHQVDEFTRFRFTITEGIIKSTYTYSGTFGRMKNPAKFIDETYIKDFDHFLSYYETFDQVLDKNPSYNDICRCLKIIFSDETFRNIMKEVHDNLVDKKLIHEGEEV